MRKLALAAGACLAFILPLTLAPSSAQAPPDSEPSQLVVGTFDSRGVAIAYANSERFRSRLAELRREHDQARQDGDQELVKALERRAEAQQARFHRQAFSTAPVDDILALVADRLPVLAREAGVDVIVSRWDLAWHDPSARLVDVTGALVNEFHPDEKVLKWVAELADHAPIPEEELEDCKDL